MKRQKKIAIYGKGGIGKSTTVANIAAAYSEDDKKVMVIGCDPKSDTTRTLCGRRIPTIVHTLKDNKKPDLKDLVFEGFNNIRCVESGGPEPGVGCAGRGVIVAMKRLENLNAFDEEFDVILYDVLGDVVCGGFSVPLREDYADEVFIVSSGEYMSLYAANNISRGIRKLKGNLGGIICNCKGLDNEEEIVSSFAKEIGTQVIGVIKRSNLIQRSELDAKTVVEYAPESTEADDYRKLANDIFENDNYSTPLPMEDEDFENFFKSFID
ncbi:MAG: Ni-sirohydrochlorin a,c-diamide reductive cyclase ATP-dependent reductase subunit [Methanobrevibacter sp.]|nr:Ni-sirohydrochlorin a,c-diamide reductive cyclase ATP-dependent reductase subunit [Methanobrevibacter sp.]